ncbi:TPR domain-containing protein [Caballeronia fortuita]|uniref:protein O-GlcNAc transferase n=1 Tax=Caballeronia fortuita TaxID=1777138 RepID=A0A158DZH5_9BURK|nr:glycosyltransferase family 41 protein [Caballeronia fortuita]SAK99830.1 TPR domain-containing protein [Caballeronia fortuita]
MQTDTLSPDDHAHAIEAQYREAVQGVFQNAVAQHNAGDLESAETLYRAVLDVEPAHADTNYNLSLLLLQTRRSAAALPLLENAIGVNPNASAYWVSYVDALTQSGNVDAAWIALEMAQQRGLGGPAIDILVSRMTIATQLRQGALAIQPAPAADAAPAPAPAPEAVSPPAVAKHPGRTKATPQETAMIVSLYNKGRIAEAADKARALTERFADNLVAWRVLGLALQRLGAYPEAAAPLERAVELNPDDYVTHTILADVHRMNGHHDASEATCRAIIERHPNYYEVHRVLCMTLQSVGRLEEAEACVKRSIELAPDSSFAYCTMGSGYLEQGRLAEAEQCFRKALELQPDYDLAHSNMMFCLSHNESMDPATLFAEHVAYGERHETPLRAKWEPHRNSRDPERKLKIGFVSGDFLQHAVANFLEPVLGPLSAFDSLSLHAYSNHTGEDQVTERLRKHFETWTNVTSMSDAAVAERIRADRIDILIDLSGHTARNRLMSFARKPAPVQATWIGYPGTTGLKAMDYFFADQHLVPPGPMHDLFLEKMAYLPAVAPFLPSSVAPPVNGLPLLRNGFATFGSFNRLNKLRPEVIALWSRILRELPDARMLLGGLPADDSIETVSGWFADEGIGRERLTFHPRARMAMYLQQHHHVDLCLDTFPYAGGTTNLHALSMGVPTLTLPGDTVPSRGGSTTLAHVGLSQFTASSHDDFVAKALYWARHPDELAMIRLGMRERCSQSPVFRPDIIAAGMNSVLRTMWQRWCRGEAAAFIDTPIL